MKLNSVLTFLFIVLLTVCKGGAYDLSAYGLKPDTGENASPLIAKALQEIAAESSSDTIRILLPTGRYDFVLSETEKDCYCIYPSWRNCGRRRVILVSHDAFSRAAARFLSASS